MWAFEDLLGCTRFEPVELLIAHAAAKLDKAALRAHHAIGTVFLLCGNDTDLMICAETPVLSMPDSAQHALPQACGQAGDAHH